MAGDNSSLIIVRKSGRRDVPRFLPKSRQSIEKKQRIMKRGKEVKGGGRSSTGKEEGGGGKRRRKRTH